jgi:hypothetical protein
MKPETYIVRIYRRSNRPSPSVAGLLETPDGKRSISFASLAELSAILRVPRESLRRRISRGAI